MKNMLLKKTSVACSTFFVLLHLTTAKSMPHSSRDFIFIEQGPHQQSTLYADGSIIDLQIETKTWPIIGSDLTNFTPQSFRQMVHAGLERYERNPHKTTVSAGTPHRGFDIVFDVTDPPPGAVAALESAATYLENVFGDDVSITIEIGFSPMAQGVLGWCMSYFASEVTWTNTRTALISGMDADDTIQVWLPSGSTIPVRYDYYSSSVTSEDRCFFTIANYRAAVGTVGGVAAHIEFNSDYSWDYDPSDGIMGSHICFQSVTCHEIGHCLGFVTAADSRPNDIEALDIYRFTLTDGSGDYNPDSYNEFQTTARTVDEDETSSLTDDAISELVTVEYRMSDGTPYQPSHFSMGNVNAIMQPAIGSGDTYYPHFYRLPDKLVFDAIGWDYLVSYTLIVNLVGNGTVEVTPDQWTYEPGTQVVLYADPDSLWEFDHWGGDLEGSQNPDTIIMDDDYEITAYFSTSYFTLTVNVIGSGSVNKNPDEAMYFAGTPVELTAIPDQGWEFDHWSGNLWGSQNPDTIVMNGNKTVNAHFEEMSVQENQTGGIEAPFVHVYPNPSSGVVMVAYGIGQVQRGELAIYDVTGELVHSFSLSASSTTFVWDGQNAVGEDVPSGVYFMKFSAGDYRTTTKLLLLK